MKKKQEIDMLVKKLYQQWKEGRLWQNCKELNRLDELGVSVVTDSGCVGNSISFLVI